MLTTLNKGSLCIAHQNILFITVTDVLNLAFQKQNFCNTIKNPDPSLQGILLLTFAGFAYFSHLL